MYQLYSTYKIQKDKYNTNAIQDPISFILSQGKKGVKNTRLLQLIDKETRLFESTDYSKLHKKLINSKQAKDLNKLNLDTALARENERMESFIAQKDFDFSESYYQFRIPKATGGFRTITAPLKDLKREQSLQKEFIEDILHLLPHNAAHGYVKERSTTTNAMTHKESKHFVKIDMKAFFPSITSEMLLEVLPKIGIFGFAQLEKTEFTIINDFSFQMKRYIKNIIELSTLNGELPQGTPISPLLSNLVLIPFDHAMYELFKEEKRSIIYTRYADDTEYSSLTKLNAKWLEESIDRVFEKVYSKKYISINYKKTRTSTNCGKNRITGIKVNAENELSVGWKEKRALKLSIMNLIIKRLSGEPIPPYTQDILGYLNYLNGVEPDYAQYLIKKLQNKFKIEHLQKFLNTY